MNPKHLTFAAAVAVLALSAVPATGQRQPTGDEPPLPSDVLLEVDAQESSVFRIGIPDLLGAAPHTSEGGGILRNDFTLMPGYTVVGPRALRHDVESEGLGVDRGAWSTHQVNAVIKGRVEEAGGRLRVEMRLFWFARGTAPALSQTYEGAPTELRTFMHDFGNEALRVVTGTLGPFGTKIAYAKRIGPGRKDVYCAHMDGHNQVRVSNGRGIAMLPSFDEQGHVWFTRLTETGMFITRSAMRGRRVIEGNGINMSPAVCDGRIFFASSRDGNSEIYSTALDGSDLRRLTNHPAIDVSPACVPGGRLAFVSARHGSPQIWMMDRDGANPRRITFRGTHNQTPAVCQHASRPLLAFTGRDEGTMDIFTVNYNTQEYTRVTQGQGLNKDPAFSPDCRILAFTSTRRGQPGVYLASPSGFNQHRVVEGEAETLDWRRTR
jgi:TolB protein